MPPHDPRLPAAFDGAIRHMAAQLSVNGRDPLEARRRAWWILECRTGLCPANPNNARHVQVLCQSAFDWLDAWSPEILDLFFPLPE